MPTLVCPKCKYHTENDERFCWKCGTALTAAGETIYCSSCGAALKPHAEFCSQCGAKRKKSDETACSLCGAELKIGEQFCWKCGTRADEFSGEIEDEKLEKLYRKGLDDYENKRYVSAVIKLKKAAEQGHPKAQFYLADCFMNGRGIRMDEALGNEWARKAGEQGINESTVRDSLEMLLEKAGDGDAYARYQLGRQITKHYYLSKPDYKNDRKWLSKAAKQGYAPAQYTIAECYTFIANQKDYSGNRRKLKEKAFALYSEAADLGHAGALFALGECYRKGEGVRQNRRKALSLFRQALEAGFREPMCLFTIGLCYDHGIGTPRNRKEAARMYQKAIAYGDRVLAPEYLRKLELAV